MMTYRLSQKGYEKLNSMAYKYRITSCDLEDCDIWSAIDKLRTMYLDDEDSEFIERIANLLDNLPTPY